MVIPRLLGTVSRVNYCADSSVSLRVYTRAFAQGLRPSQSCGMAGVHAAGILTGVTHMTVRDSVKQFGDSWAAGLLSDCALTQRRVNAMYSLRGSTAAQRSADYDRMIMMRFGRRHAEME